MAWLSRQAGRLFYTTALRQLFRTKYHIYKAAACHRTPIFAAPDTHRGDGPE